MLTRVDISDPLGANLKSLVLGPPSSTTKYVVRDIQGLGPVKSDINTTTFAGLDGDSYNSARVGGRNIVITLDYNPDWSANETIQQLRRALYIPAGAKKLVLLTFYFDTYALGAGADAVCSILGYVESHEPAIFNKDGSVVLSIICTDPYFKGGVHNTTGMTGAATIQSITNAGDLATGFKFDFVTPVALKSLKLEKLDAAGAVSQGIIDIASGSTVIAAIGTTLEISTLKRTKYVRNLPSTSLLRYLTNSPLYWPQMDVGINNFKVYNGSVAPTFPDGTFYTMSYTRLYEGV